MPYSKTVMDQEGASAEAISVELSYLANISHPAEDKPTISIEPNGEKFAVQLPAYKLGGFNGASLLLSEMGAYAGRREYFDGIEDEEEREECESYEDPFFSEKFLTSLGATIAFDWYIGQGDLSPTNVSVYDNTCYPFDFDCCFQNIQSSASFAKSREQQFKTIDLDTLDDETQIIQTAIKNISEAALHLTEGKFNGTQLSKTLDPLLAADKLKMIRHGFQNKLTDLANIKLEKVQAIVDKYVLGAENKKAYMDYMSYKHKNVEMMRNNNKSASNFRQSLNEIKNHETIDDTMIKSESNNHTIKVR
jgi:hypothetical protein